LRQFFGIEKLMGLDFTMVLSFGLSCFNDSSDCDYLNLTVYLQYIACQI